MSRKSRKSEGGSWKWAALRPSAHLRRGGGFRIVRRPHAAFTLFEVLIALGVFAIAVTGLVVALDSAVMAAFEARERALARMVLESRLSAVLSDPPVTGYRVIEARDNNGVRVEETMEKFEAKTTNGTPVTGLWKIKVSADWGERGRKKETAEILLFKP
ncbi:MAG: prepilin-type N-terminal cleavage/methylation domain-containing protein [Verrucomicrobia bacterium]|nr:prepilin-type N-terminal cleavage/methylation domain-containing protein [Verrucomicrobiota bacterium]